MIRYAPENTVQNTATTITKKLIAKIFKNSNRFIYKTIISLNASVNKKPCEINC